MDEGLLSRRDSAQGRGWASPASFRRNRPITGLRLAGHALSLVTFQWGWEGMADFMTDSSVLADPVDKAPAADAFYTPPNPLPQGNRGEPIYQRRLANDAVTALDDGDNWLVLYRSQDAHGNAVATSGIIAVPRTAPPAGGFPVISWAHGTVGVADLCAPSRNQPSSQAHPMNVYVQTLLNAFGATHTCSACPKPPVSWTSSRRPAPVRHPDLTSVRDRGPLPRRPSRSVRRLPRPRLERR